MKIPEIIIKKPLYETDRGFTVGVWDKRIKDAIRNRTLINVGTKGIVKQFLPKWIRANCKTIEKVYLRYNEPMVLYEIFLPKPRKKTAEEKEEEIKKMVIEAMG
ncbi:MAG TPA: hypothetical protein ENH85_00485 [Candidatus Scalindua sp.]|nr:hypothetical protein [Candidatus Scalindua sp.]